MAVKFDPSPGEIAEYERAAIEVTRLRRKGIHCHLENHPDGPQSHVDVVRDLWPLEAVAQSEVETSSAASRKEG